LKSLLEYETNKHSLNNLFQIKVTLLLKKIIPVKVSIITVVQNCKEYIEDCIQSVISQLYPDIEYIVIDGHSTDGTLGIINRYQSNISHCLSEPDGGMYAALNKGIAMATGDIVGILNADDYFVNQGVVGELVQCLLEHNCDAVYGNLNYVNRADTDRIFRKWLSRNVNLKDLERGWMPAHPTLFIRRKYFDLYGCYAIDFGTAADYELILRFLYTHRLKAVFLDKLLVNMRTGGMSNGSLKKRCLALMYDYKAIRSHNLPNPFVALTLKKIRKLRQFF
jgi:glycosyltransferase involved in cell wall biosynthesis